MGFPQSEIYDEWLRNPKLHGIRLLCPLAVCKGQVYILFLVPEIAYIHCGLNRKKLANQLFEFPKFDVKLNRFSAKCINKNCDVDLFEVIDYSDGLDVFHFEQQIHTCVDRPKLNMWTDKNFYFFTYKGWGEHSIWRRNSDASWTFCKKEYHEFSNFNNAESQFIVYTKRNNI